MIFTIWFLFLLATSEGFIEVSNYKFEEGAAYNVTAKPPRFPPYVIYFRNLKGTLYRESLSLLPSTVKKLWIENSKLDEIESGALCSSPFEEITLFQTSTPDLTADVFGNCSSLNKITISSHDSAINGTFSQLKNLKSIVILSNLPSIQKTLFSGLAALESLSVLHSGVESIEPGAFDDLVSLRYLDLSGNKIESLNGTLTANLSQLLSLELDWNALEEFPWDDLVHLGQLELLNLDRNNLPDLDEQKLATFLPKLKVLDFQHNNMSCGKIMDKIGAIRAIIIGVEISDYRCTKIQ